MPQRFVGLEIGNGVYACPDTGQGKFFQFVNAGERKVDFSPLAGIDLGFFQGESVLRKRPLALVSAADDEIHGMLLSDFE